MKMEINMENNVATDIIDLCLDDNIDGLQSTVNDALMARIHDVLAAKKIEVAQRFFNPEEQNG
jgi:hypothetical protein